MELNVSPSPGASDRGPRAQIARGKVLRGGREPLQRPGQVPGERERRERGQCERDDRGDEDAAVQGGEEGLLGAAQDEVAPGAHAAAPHRTRQRGQILLERALEFEPREESRQTHRRERDGGDGQEDLDQQGPLHDGSPAGASGSILYPTPNTVSTHFGCRGSSPSLRRRFLT
jgi:hypothetical protein